MTSVGGATQSAGDRRKTWRLWRSLLKTTVFVALVGLVGLLAPVALLLLEGRPIDTTVAHGDECLASEGQPLRCWDVFVPDDLGSDPVPLLIDLHGFLNTTERQRSYSEYEPLAAQDGVIVAWPYGIDWSWNGGGDPWPSDSELVKRPGIGCCGYALNNDVDDVAFIVAMIEQLGRSHAIDRDRVFLSGFSNGCILAQRVAAEASQAIDGVACMAGHLLVEPAPDYRPVPILEIHGTTDPVSEYEPGYWPGSVPNFDSWRKRNGCTEEPIEVWRDGPHTMIEATGCIDDATVALVTLDGFGHPVFAGENWLPVDTRRLAWDFLIGRSA